MQQLIAVCDLWLHFLCVSKEIHRLILKWFKIKQRLVIGAEPVEEAGNQP
ncbi:hypothetical protein [Paenibacillus andongensis]|nr:hypothetical protein [Paenibacillus andongensis]